MQRSETSLVAPVTAADEKRDGVLGTARENAASTRTAPERMTILLAVYAQLTSSALGYHSIVINVNVMCLSVNTFLVGYLIGNNPAVHTAPKWLLALIPGMLAMAGGIVTWVIRSHYLAIASIIRRLDVIFGSFTNDYFAPGPALYPIRWRNYGTRQWHEIVFEMFIPLQALMGAIGITLVSLR
jgi:hypothetical protein